MDMFTCRICDRNFNRLKGLAQHIRHTHGITAKEYYLRYVDPTAGKCYCGNDTPFISLQEGFQEHCCSTCSNRDPKVVEKINEVKRSFSDEKKQAIREKTIKTSIDRYGGIGFASAELSEKSKTTSEKIHGSRNYNNREKCKNTWIQRTGYVSNLAIPENIESYKQVKQEKYDSATFNNAEKRAETNLCRYGVVCPANSVSGREKSINTMIEHSGSVEQSYKDRAIKIRDTKEKRYGDGGYHNVEKAKITMANKDYTETSQKRRATCMEKYDVDSYSKTEEFLEKYETTNMERYGYKYPFAQGKFKQNYSKGEKEVANFVRTIYTGLILEGDRKVLQPTEANGWKAGHELDIYLPNLKLAIEYNGNYYHDYDRFPEKKILDEQKQRECDLLGIRLITIWENDWKKNPNMVMEILENAIVRKN